MIYQPLALMIRDFLQKSLPLPSWQLFCLLLVQKKINKHSCFAYKNLQGNVVGSHICSKHRLIIHDVQTIQYVQEFNNFNEILAIAILYTGKFRPFYFRSFLTCCQWANLRLDEFRCLKLSLCIQLFLGEFRTVRSLLQVKMAKLTRGKNILYTVYSVHIKGLQNEFMYSTNNFSSILKSILHIAAGYHAFLLENRAGVKAKISVGKKSLSFRLCNITG